MNKRYFIASVAALAFMPFASGAQTAPSDAVTTWLADPTIPLSADSIDVTDFQWIARTVAVFADSPNDPAFIEQMTLLEARSDELAERDVVVIYDTDPDARSPLRLKLRPRGFMLALVGKDGQIVLRKPSPWDVRELSRSIDKMPMRQTEIDDRRGSDQ
ncbi:DUF4174 domain-containing protein [Loktanella sp. SALINAS62]|uniref:DUF4174 domain-containing protein n=1 Tax=Loktanella sp. SALINAS62 TaxID=2706124 RepID=UPI001B8BC11D|nr:DUF4174 domain-containing protein [Loktanella sp. SALINAS62]MBS1303143.1 DUF4174 domain-containing protein [Loktanella sp. SALINAS62]